ncbi:MAG: preprotein translocase subunit SecG [Pseudomonadota bacterium]
METVIIVIHLMVVLALVAVILLQRSEGGALGMGGGGGGGGMMSARGAANALTRTTGILAVAFFITSLTLGILAKVGESPSDVLDVVPTTGTETGVPATNENENSGSGDTGGSGGILNRLEGQNPETPSTGVPATE